MRTLGFLLAGLPLVASFNHPGLLVSSNDVSRLKGKLAANLAPWKTSWEVLTSMDSGNVPYTPQAVEGNTSYADAAADILTSWAETLTSLGANDDQYIVAGLQGHEMANAGELLRDYAPFRENGLASFQTMMQEVFLEKNMYFLNHLDGSEHNVLHFFANWELAQVASVLAIGVLTDNKTTWDFGINYFKNGSGNGAIKNAITTIVEEPGTGRPLGQGQEEGRDQGHSSLDYALLGVIAQQAWNQGEDLYAYNNSAILLGAEYFARYNLGYDVPFVNYTNGIMGWEVLYNHYVKIKGQDAPWTTKYWNLALETWGTEIGSGAYGSPAVSGYYDTLGWGTILYRLDDSDMAAARAASGSSLSSSIPSFIPSSVPYSVASSSKAASSSTSSTTFPLSAPISTAPSFSTMVKASPASSSSLNLL
ncbi:chondroitin AC/alginate lyase [Aspergillus japonicus CBS 114.51]|uniref:Chondroitin AC/alginate lyase n=1 Tax=Aspergillus japonicus CBS 114.51 TaxID=1448312 RepID=A0A8T8WYF3_ASPJA|nr:chondroitin AC/alginate lyase [Aspergillus japonicus CBS 114.51]RAH80868.1 chondroitin AC/alginate lyase [Aspergillus japonicus CBS 114.51]